MDQNSPTPRFTFVYGTDDTHIHETMIAFPDDEMAIDYAEAKLRELNRAHGWTTVAIGRGHGDDVQFIGAWHLSEGAMTWVRDE